MLPYGTPTRTIFNFFPWRCKLQYLQPSCNFLLEKTSQFDFFGTRDTSELNSLHFIFLKTQTTYKIISEVFSERKKKKQSEREGGEAENNCCQNRAVLTQCLLAKDALSITLSITREDNGFP